MGTTREDHVTPVVPEIRIERVNADKTRKDIGSETVYHVYFELSGHPPTEWTSIFVREWKKQQMKHEAGVDGAFLVVHCELGDVAATEFPALKKIVAETNEEYQRYAQKEQEELERREDSWKQERNAVDAMAGAL